MGVRKLWKRLNEGWTGIFFSVFLGILFATFFYYVVLAGALQTSLPVVAVISSSMDHGISGSSLSEIAYPCGNKIVESYDENFDNWWNLCGGSYSQFDISKEKFSEFPFKDGFKLGDMPVVQGSGDYKEGDIVVYTAADCQTGKTVERAPIIHRIVKIENGVYHTKGDHNRNQNYYENCIKKEQIHGKVIFIVPKLGYVKVLAAKLLGI